MRASPLLVVVVFLSADIDEPFFILVSMADYKDYICTFELNGCNLGSYGCIYGVPNKDGLPSFMYVTSSTNPWEESPYCRSFLTVHFYDVDFSTAQSYSFCYSNYNVNLSTLQANYILSFVGPCIRILYQVVVFDLAIRNLGFCWLGSTSILFCRSFRSIIDSFDYIQCVKLGLFGLMVRYS
jgi:hypothetical protein